eukprot:352414-Chlamydomonas_euryale.AAC.2
MVLGTQLPSGGDLSPPLERATHLLGMNAYMASGREGRTGASGGRGECGHEMDKLTLVLTVPLVGERCDEATCFASLHLTSPHPNPSSEARFTATHPSRPLAECACFAPTAPEAGSPPEPFDVA